MDEFFNLVHQLTGLDSTKLVLVVMLASMLARFFGPLIPDDSVGFWGFLRKVLNIVGLYSSNRITSGVSVNDVVKVVANSTTTVRDESGKFTGQTVADAAKTVSSHWAATLLAMAMIGMLVLGGCTTAQTQRLGQIGVAVCNNVPLAQALLDNAADSKRKATAQKVFDDLKIACPLLLPQLNTARVEAVAAQLQ